MEQYSLLCRCKSSRMITVQFVSVDKSQSVMVHEESISATMTCTQHLPTLSVIITQPSFLLKVSLSFFG